MGRYKDYHREPKGGGYDDDHGSDSQASWARPNYASPSAPQGSEPVRATVKWFNAEKGFGFVAVEGGSEAFMHIRQLETAGHRSVTEGARVKVRIGQGQRGLEVTEVIEVDKSTGQAASTTARRPTVVSRVVGQTTEVTTIVARGWSEAQCQAYAIADNRLTESSEWSDELLQLELSDLREAGFDLTLTGFSENELDRLLEIDADLDGDPDEAPALPAQPVTRPGDLWICGEHRVLCGDATVLNDVEKVLDGELADMTFCDPPYGVNYANSSEDKRRGKNRPILNDNLGDEFGTFLYDACVNILTVTNGAVYVCMSSSELDRLQEAFRKAGGKWSTFVIRAKNTFTLGRSDYQRQYEPILYGWKDGGDHYWCGARDQGDVWFFDKPAKNDLHPTMKPVALVERAIRNSSKSRDIVLDPFGGSGTTLIAAARAGRRFRWDYVVSAGGICNKLGSGFCKNTAEHSASRGDMVIGS